MPTVKVFYKDRGKGVATVHVPAAELLILQTLAAQRLTAREIARKSPHKISVNGVYTLLNRLKERGLVERQEGSVEILDLSLRRVYYVTTFDGVEETQAN